MISINIRTLAGLLALTIFFFLLSPAFSQAEIIDRIVASAGNDAITLFDVEREGAAVFRDINMNAPESQRENLLYEARKRIVESLVEKLLLLREAERMGIEVSEGELSSAVDGVLAENRIGRKELDMALAQEGITFDKYQADLKEQILRSKLLDRKIRGAIKISDEEIKIYFESNKESFGLDDEIRVRHILFLVPKGASRKEILKIKDRAELILNKARSGEKFEDLAREYSEGPSANSGGDLGFFKKADMVKEFSSAAFALKKDEISSLVLSPFGFHIIKLLEKRGGTSLSFDDAKERIRAKLFNDEMERGISNLIEDLKERDDLQILL
ncbi:MAG: peptidylprolyl isomerase [bacterium]|nr:peptidylprolyl isomerase [bacterium]